MAKKYTVMIFDPEKYGKSKTLLLSTRPFWVVGIVLVLLLSSTLVAFTFFNTCGILSCILFLSRFQATTGFCHYGRFW